MRHHFAAFRNEDWFVGLLHLFHQLKTFGLELRCVNRHANWLARLVRSGKPAERSQADWDRIGAVRVWAYSRHALVNRNSGASCAGRSESPPARIPQPAAVSKENSPPSSHKSVKYDPDESVSAAPGLTTREEEVYHWVVRGKENEEVAQILGGNSETIRKHVENIRRKVGGESRLAVIASYWQQEVEKRDRLIADLRRQLARES